MTSVFPSPPQTPGHGLIHAKVLPPHSYTLEEFQFVYPLKLISSSTPTDKFLTVFVLSYGGGLVSNDKINLDVVLEEGVKACVLTQGSTKIFKLRPGDTLTSQYMNVYLHAQSSLVLLPDPLQPFAASSYFQHQRFYLPPGTGSASLVVLDWVSEGRTARSEHWALKRFISRNEFFESGHPEFPDGRKLLLKDSLILHGDGDYDAPPSRENLRSRMDELACVSTLIIRGPRFANLAAFVLERYKAEPRIGGGGRGWNFDKNRQEEGVNSRFKDIIWTAASVRGFVLVKVSAKEIEEARKFLRDLLLEGKEIRSDNERGIERVEELPDIIREYGLGALRCLE